MNLNIKKILTLAGVGVISILTTFQSLTNTEAALTAPASWDFKYTNQDFPGFKLRNTTSVISTPQYTRTADGAYYNYTVDFEVVEGLNITQTFNRSNTSWYQNGSVWIPSGANVGSNNTVGIIRKFNFIFDNQTNNDYFAYFDFSSTSNYTVSYEYSYNSNLFTQIHFPFEANFLAKRLYIPSFTTFTLTMATNSLSSYFDAWYLEDLGVSASYQEGYDIGYDIGEADGYQDGLGNNPNILLNGFQAMVGILVNFMLLILNLEAFGVSILSVFGVLAFFVGVIWFFKLLRG